MYMHVIYKIRELKEKKKIREFLSYKEFNLIKFYFSVHKSACVCFQLFQCLTISGDTSGSSGVRCNYCKQVANRRHISARERYRDCVSSGSLRAYFRSSLLSLRKIRTLFFGGREATIGNTSAVRRLVKWSPTGGQKQLKILNNHL